MAATSKGKKPAAKRAKPQVPATAADRLAALVRIRTVAAAPGEEQSPETAQAFADMRAALESFYPRTFAAAELDEVGRGGLLMRLAGAVAERPVVLMAHQDVVPVPEDWQSEGWERPPFDGVIADGRVHGRGTLDDKGALVALLEAVEAELAAGWEPPRDVYLLLGADEEVYGTCAAAGARLLAERGVEPWMVLDEGGAIATGALPGLNREAAIVGVSEKGVSTIDLIVRGDGGHASTPPAESAAGIVARAVARVEAKPFPVAVNDVTVEMFERLAPHIEGRLGAVLSRARLLRPVLARALARMGPELAAVVRTTVAVTRLEGSAADNVLATRAAATLNVRIAPGESVAGVVERLERVIGDSRVGIVVREGSEPSPVSPTGDDPRWAAVEAAAAVAYPDAVAAPYVMLGASDARHLARACEATYRLSPLRMDKQQREAVHGPNEWVAVESLELGIDFYRALLTGPALATPPDSGPLGDEVADG